MGYLNRGTDSFHRITSDQLEARRLVSALNPAQLRVLSRLVEGDSLHSIANELGFHVAEIEQVRSEILCKLEAHTTADLIRIGIYAEIPKPR